MVQAITISNAFKQFGEIPALDGASLNIEQGERVALLGPNGAGKTTLIRVIAGRCRLDSGELVLFGEPANKLSRRKIGLIPQELAIHALLSAEENLNFFGRLQGLTGSELKTQVGHALEWTGLESRKRDATGTFSGGMKRRLNIACGVLHRPELILLDEPTVGVDPQSRERIHQMLLDLHSQGAALLLTTHMMEEAERGTDRVVIQDHGRCVANGTPQELVDSCFGGTRTLKIQIEGTPELPEGSLWKCDGSALIREVDRVEDVADLIKEVNQMKVRINGIQVDPPSLQEVFIHLTGRELRE